MKITRNSKTVSLAGAVLAFATTPELSNIWGLVAAVVTGAAVLAGSHIGAAISVALIPHSLRLKVGIRNTNDLSGLDRAQRRFAQDPTAHYDLIKWGLYNTIGLVAGAIVAYALAKPAIERVLPHKAAYHADATPNRPPDIMAQEGKRLIATIPQSENWCAHLIAKTF